MNYEHLKTFVSVAERKSFSETAKKLYLSQPTITSQIKSLEKSLSTTLFERTTKQVELTPAAKILYRYATKIINLSEEAEKEIANLLGKVHGDLFIPCSLTIGENILPNLLKTFTEKYPLIELSAAIVNSTQILNMINDNVADIGLIEAPLESPGLVLEPFMEDELIIIAKNGFFDGGKMELGLDDLVKTPMIVREKDSGTRAVMNQYLTESGISTDDLNVILELGSTEGIKSAVESGLGISIISKNSIYKELKLGVLKTYKIPNVFFSRHFYVVYKRGAILKSPSEKFLELLRNNKM
ncbi:selenium metabolism-associated LysR family transcriptional regulator [Alkalihalobacillus shacheensis]|uniref:selenium metabolism-associated LysR family transcriptional regulator n=1 Tax=Shouchella shacheensis TaxID=1649580 RepID=UPI00073FF47F